MVLDMGSQKPFQAGFSDPQPAARELVIITSDDLRLQPELA